MRCYHTIPPSRASCATISSRCRWLIANRALLLFELIPFAPHPHFCSYHMKLFHEEATQYYVKCTHLFHYEPAQCPALLLVSKTDPVGTEKANNRLRSIWESVGVKVSCVHPFRKTTYAYTTLPLVSQTSLKCWDKSPHVGHFHKHRDEYIELLLAHLRALDLPMYNRKAKL